MGECISPLSLPRPNGRGPQDRINPPCGKCLHCLRNLQDIWSFRIAQEHKISKSSFFLTVTYADEELIYSIAERRPELHKKHFVDFIKRLRHTNYPKDAKVRYNDPKYPTVRYYAVGEYGTETKRPHYHAIIFNLTEKAQKNLSETWKKGITRLDPCNSASIHYVTKYVISRHADYGQLQKPFALMSRMPAIGANYLSSAMKKYHKDNQSFQIGGRYKLPIPPIYRDQIFSKTEIIHENYRKELERIKKEKKQIAHLIKTGYNKSYEHFMFEAKHLELTNLEKRLKEKQRKL